MCRVVRSVTRSVITVWFCSGLIIGCTTAGPDAAPTVPADFQEQQMVRVIVQLRVASTGSDDEERIREIIRAKEALFRELISTSYKVTRTYDTIPFVALQVSPQALRVLEQSVWVVGIEEDVLSAPQ